MNEKNSTVADVIVNTTYLFKAIQPLFRKGKVVGGKLYSRQEGRGTSDEKIHLRNLKLNECPPMVIKAKQNTPEVIILEEKYIIAMTPLFNEEGKFAGAELYSQKTVADRLSGETVIGNKEFIRRDQVHECSELLKNLAFRDGQEGSPCEYKHLRTYEKVDYLLKPVFLKGHLIGAKLFFSCNAQWQVCGFMLKPEFERIIDNSTIPAEELRKLYMAIEQPY